MPSSVLFASGYGGSISSLEFDSATNELKVVDTTPAGKAPSWLAKHPDESVLYSTDRVLFATDEFAEGGGIIMAFSIEDRHPRLRPLCQCSLKGQGPVHLEFSKDGKTLFSAQYVGASVASIQLDNDGRCLASQASNEAFFSGSGPHKERQEAPHPHGVFLEPSGRYVLACDLGLDKIHVFKADSTLQELGSMKTGSGHGPRHLRFKKNDGKVLVYLVSELANVVSVFVLEYDQAGSCPLKLVPVQTDISTLPPNSSQPDKFTAAELNFTPDGKHLIVSNRCPEEPGSGKTDHLVVFEVESSGKLKDDKTFVPLNGLGPRDLAFTETADGRTILASTCQKTNEVVLFEWRDQQLVEVARASNVPQPTCVLWL